MDQHESATGKRFCCSAPILAILGLLAAGMGCVVASYGSTRLGIGRHGEVWWRPFANSLTAAHIENLAVFAVGITGIAIGAWLVVSAIRCELCRRSVHQQPESHDEPDGDARD